MPTAVDSETKGKIVTLRAMDKSKQQIAEELDVSRNTVSKYLKNVQREAEESEHPELVVARATLEGIAPGTPIPELLDMAAHEAEAKGAFLDRIDQTFGDTASGIGERLEGLVNDDE